MVTNKYVYLFISLIILGFVIAFPASAQDEGTIGSDEIVSGQITDEQFEQFYTFEGNEGDTILVSMTASETGLDSYLRLLDINGQELAYNDDGGEGLNSLLGPYILRETGTYTIVATRYMQENGVSVGTYELSLSLTQLDALQVGQDVVITLDDTQSTEYFSYSGQTGETLRLVGTASNYVQDSTPYSIYVTDESGMWINSGYVNMDGIVTLDPIYFGDAGNYIVTVRYEERYDNNGNILPMEDALTVTLTLSNILPTPIEFGAVQEGVLNIGDAHYYRFSADSGTLTNLTGSHLDGDNPFEVQIFNVDGQSIAGVSTGYEPNLNEFTLDPLRLIGSTDYLMVVRPVNNNNTGTPITEGTTTYTIAISMTETPVIEAGVQVSGMVGEGNYEEIYRFMGEGGQRVRITLNSVDDNYALSINIDADQPEDPQANQFYGYVMNMNSPLSGTLSYEFVLPESGVYLLRVSNARLNTNGREPLAGQFTLLVEVVQ